MPAQMEEVGSLKVVVAASIKGNRRIEGGKGRVGENRKPQRPACLRFEEGQKSPQE